MNRIVAICLLAAGVSAGTDGRWADGGRRLEGAQCSLPRRVPDPPTGLRVAAQA